MARMKKDQPGHEEAVKKWKETIQRRYGTNWREMQREAGRKGGSAKVSKGFALMTKEQRIAAGRKGGTISRRGEAKKNDVQ